MKISNKALEKKAEEALRTCLSKVPFLKIQDIQKQPERGDKRPDFLVRLALRNAEKNLIVEVKTNGQPRLAREAVNQLLRYLDVFPGGYGVFRVLLNNPQERWKIKTLSDEAGVSLGQVSNVKKLLNDREWIRTDREGFLLSAPEALLGRTPAF